MINILNCPMIPVNKAAPENIAHSTSSTTECHPTIASCLSCTYSSCSSEIQRLQEQPCSPHRPLPDILIDFMALQMYDLLPTKQQPFGKRTAPELLYFIQNVTTHARISCHIAVVALIYIERCKKNLPKNAVGDEDTAHRIFIASVLVASKFLHGTAWASSQQQLQEGDDLLPAEAQVIWLTNVRMANICAIYNVLQITQFERSFLNLIHHRCWVDTADVQSYLVRHRQDLLL